MKMLNSNGFRNYIGQMALHQSLELKIPLPAVQSCVAAGARFTTEKEGVIEARYPIEYDTDGTTIGNLRFAFRHEPLSLLTLATVFEAIDPQLIQNLVKNEPTGAFSRRLWFFYEWIRGKRLDLESSKSGNYADALDSRFHFVAKPVNSPRHRVRNNLLGTSELCPTVRRTAKLEAFIATDLKSEALALTSMRTPEALARAANFLYAKETRSSFAIEGEAPHKNREERFLHALQSASAFDFTDKTAIIRLQGDIVDPRYSAKDWRVTQNFVGESTRNFGEFVHYICPRPQDVPELMCGWTSLTERMLSSSLDPVIAAAVSSFAFVFIHPFEDGNGRLHRFLIHYFLSKSSFVPLGIIFPVSVSILRDRIGYDRTLEAFSKPLLKIIDWELKENDSLIVKNDTKNLYRFYDSTVQAEYLYDRVAETVHLDFKHELEFLEAYDFAFAALRDIVDMPDRRASLLVRLCLQNGGRLSANKRKLFEELTDEEIARIETAMTSLTEVYSGI